MAKILQGRKFSLLLAILFLFVSAGSAFAEMPDYGNTYNGKNVPAVAIGSTVSDGIISPTGDKDYFKFTATLNKRYVIRAGGALSSDITLYKRNGTTILSGPTTPEISWQCTSTAGGSGTYYVRVRKLNGGSGTGAYTLFIDRDDDNDGYTATSDCNDNDAAVHPGAVELCDGVDNDCNDIVDDACTSLVPAQYSTIQAAIDATPAGCTVLVSDGTYYENINFNGKAITVRSVNGAASATINGGANGSVVTFNTSEGVNSILTGFTITNGSSGGIYCNSSSPTIDNCTINNNTGGGIGCNYSSPTIRNCAITGNSAPYGSAGGIFCYVSSPTIDTCTITGNTATVDGGGLYLWSSPLTVIIGGDISGNAPNDIVYIP